MNEPNHNKRFRWLIEVEVSETWVADGFCFDGNVDRCSQIEEALLPFADPDEVSVRLVKSPAPIQVRESQGYAVDPAELFAPQPEGGYTEVVELKTGDECYRRPLDDEDSGESPAAIEPCYYCAGTGHVPSPSHDRDGRRRDDWPPTKSCEYCGGSGECEEGSKLLPARRPTRD